MTLNDLEWPLGDLCGKSWPLITKIMSVSDSLTPKTYTKWCHLSFWYFLIFYLFSGVADFQGARKIQSGGKNIGYRNFCVLWTLKGHEKLKLKNEHENLAKGVFVTKYHTLYVTLPIYCLSASLETSTGYYEWIYWRKI